jgi:hypothetical protein
MEDFLPQRKGVPHNAYPFAWIHVRCSGKIKNGLIARKLGNWNIKVTIIVFTILVSD